MAQGFVESDSGSLYATDFVETLKEICSGVPCQEGEGSIVFDEGACDAANESCDREREEEVLGVNRLVLPVLFHVFCNADDTADESAKDAEENGGEEDGVHVVIVA